MPIAYSHLPRISASLTPRPQSTSVSFSLGSMWLMQYVGPWIKIPERRI